MSEGSRGPRAPEGEHGSPVREREAATRTRTKRPARFKVALFNDDYTPMDFVVWLLESLFGKGPAEATQLMLQIHHSGVAIAGVYVLEVAETKVAQVHQLAEQNGYPLRAGTEPE